VEATGLYRGSIPSSGPAANTDDTQVDPQSQYIMRTILRTKSSSTAGAVIIVKATRTPTPPTPTDVLLTLRAGFASSTRLRCWSIPRFVAAQSAVDQRGEWLDLRETERPTDAPRLFLLTDEAGS
jgi:hypothetical protein